MSKRSMRWLLVLILAGLLFSGGGFFLSASVLVLHLQNMDHPRAVSVAIKPQERFSIYYVHSVHGGSVIEEFEAAPDTIILKGVRTKSVAIAEQYGFDQQKTVHPMNENLGAIFLRVAEGEGQGVIVGDRKIYLSEIGARGDRIQLSVRSLSRGAYLCSRISTSF
jgi:hypothetical protein